MKYTSLKDVPADDTQANHTDIFREFTQNVNSTPYLKTHRDVVERFGYGYGERAFHWAWDLLVREGPEHLKFLEIGVFQGQTLSLVKHIARNVGKTASVYGVTPLNTTGDKYAQHPELDYLERIKGIHNEFSLSSPTLLRGYSFDPRIQKLAREEGPYDILYVDGCHDYEVVLDDLETYTQMLRDDGILVVDDAGNYLDLPPGLLPHNFMGLEDVSLALSVWRRTTNLEVTPLFSVGHMQIFRVGHD